MQKCKGTPLFAREDFVKFTCTLIANMEYIDFTNVIIFSAVQVTDLRTVVYFSCACDVRYEQQEIFDFLWFSLLFKMCSSRKIHIECLCYDIVQVYKLATSYSDN